jgi:transcriptional regulator with XRE-family HTH domain
MKSTARDPADPSVPLGFRQVLQAELARRCSNNPHYSLRAFAKYLGLDHSTLSQLLRGKRRLTARSIQKFGARLGMDAETIAIHIAREEQPEPAGDEALVREVRELARDTASLIADWQHYAILELVHLHDFRPDSRWIARVLGISVDEVNVSLQRLLRLGLLEMAAPDRWVDRQGDATASLRSFALAAVERFSEQVRQHLLRAVQSLPAGRYDYSSTTVAVNTARVPAAIDKIARLRDELLAFVAASDSRDDVYQLEISFVPVTRLQSKETNRGPTRDALADRDQEP